MTKLLPLIAFIVAPSLLAQAVARHNVVVGVGEELMHATSVSIATVTSPAGTNSGAGQVVRATPEQYGQNILLRGVKKGEAKLLVESTASRVAEVINVTVVDKPVAAQYRTVAAAMASVDGIGRDGVVVGEKSILITGRTFSAADQARCMALEKAPRGVSVTCAARLNSALPAVFPEAGYTPLPNALIEEEFGEASGDVAGSERSSTWVATIRLGDVPVMLLSAPSKSAMVARAATFTTRLRTAIAGWKRAADQGRVYPVTAASRRTATGYEIAMVSRLDQGSRGETLATFTFDELQKATLSSGATSDQLAEWWAALLQDAFRLYFMGSIPLRTGSGPDNPLMQTYRAALRLDDSPLSRVNAPARIARGYTAVRWRTGGDPFATSLTTVPPAFSGASR